MRNHGIDYDRIVDLDRYPLDQPDSPDCHAMIDHLSRRLREDLYCALPGFLRDDCRRDEIRRVDQVLSRAHHAQSLRNIYLERTRTEGLPDDHPRNVLNPASYHMLGTHLLPKESALRQLYSWPRFRDFVAAITGETLYPSADPYQPVNVLCHGPGDRSAWHFDSDNAFTMTLMLQAPEGGGVFEMRPNSRSPDDPNIEGLRRFLAGDRDGVRSIAREEGTLLIFRGRDSAHRVTPVTGNRNRLMAVMVYENSPGVVGDPVVNATVYGV